MVEVPIQLLIREFVTVLDLCTRLLSRFHSFCSTMTTEQTTSSKKLLITGGSGFISIETIKQALEARHQVRTTIRSQSKQKIIIDALTSRSIDVSNLSFIQTDLLKDENWSQACKDIEIVLHIASPFPSSSPKNQDELIKPAVEGTLRVLKAAKEQKVKKVVVTSSIAAICFGNEWKNKVFTEEDWSDLNGGEGTAYLKSKTLAEKAVWEFYGNQTVESGDGNGDANGEDYKMEIAVVNPAAVFGPPIIVPSESTTVGIIQQMLSGKMPIAVDLSFGVVGECEVFPLFFELLSVL